MTPLVVAKPASSQVKRALWGRFAASGILAVGLVACASQPPTESEVSEQSARSESGGKEATPTEASATPDETPVFTIAGGGDVLIHDQIREAAQALAEAGTAGQDYDFTPLMDEVEDWIAGADLALCGLEVPIVPPGREPSGYPVFSAPEELTPALAETGFDGCSTANNHAMDAGPEGIERTLEVLDEHELGHVGTARTKDEAAQPQFYTLSQGTAELTVAHLATTQIHNNVPDESWMLTEETAERMTERAAEAREQGADIVVVSVHWGTEFALEPDEAQRDYGEALAAGGEVDLVLGSHPHTPQPLEQLDGGPHDAGMWVAWSMGNFLTNQDSACCVMETVTGAIVYATVEAPGDQPARITEVQWTPVTVDRSAAGHRGIWPLAELVAADELPKAIELDVATVQERWDRALEVVGEQRVLTEPPEPAGQQPVVVPRAG